MKPAAIILVIAALCLPMAVTGQNGFVLDEPLVPAEEVVSGGPPRDGIPSLENPKFVEASSASFLSAKDRVLGITLNGITRAYPIKIMNYHEIVNDNLGGVALTITYCPLCGTGMAFEGNVNGTALEFGVSGLLYNSDMLMYDRQTGSLWSQIHMLAINGPLKGIAIKQLALTHTTWEDWHTRHPTTEVLSNDTGYERNYRADPYPNYGRNKKLYFPVNETNRDYKRKEMTLGLEIDGRFKAYPFKELKRGKELKDGSMRFQDELNGVSFEVVYEKRYKTARIIDGDGKEIPTTLAFWFAWYAFHPDTEIYRN